MNSTFVIILRQRSLEKSSNKKFFEPLQKEFRTALLGNDFLEDNWKPIPEATQADLDTSIEKLRNKYNNIQRNWRKNVDRAKTGSGLDVKKEQKWFQIMHPVLTDTNTVFQCIRSPLSRKESFRGILQ